MRPGDIVRCTLSGVAPDGRAIGAGMQRQGPFGYGARGQTYTVLELLGENGVYLENELLNTHGRGDRSRFEVVQEAPQRRRRRRNIDVVNREQFTMWVIVWRNAAGGLSQSTFTTEEAARNKVRSLELDGREILLRKKLTFDL